VSLSSPIVEQAARARVTLDDEDRVAPPRTTEDDARIDGLVDDLRAGEDVGAELVAMGPRAMERLTDRFPGPLEVLRRDLGALPPPSAHGPLLRAVIAMGDHVVPQLLRLFINPSPDVRFYTAFVFQELRDSRCMRPMASLAFDPDAEVRIIAMRVLETYCRAPGFGDATGIVRTALSGDNRTRQLQAARAVGTLRDVDAIEPLIGLLSNKDRYVQEAALESLCSITGQQHGLKPHRWRQWFVEHGGGHRVEWIVDSLRHKDLPVRRWAYDELLRITGQRIAFEPSGDRKERDAAVREWTDWWLSEGREQLTTPE
jgi:HEAT repeat protein